MNIKTLLSFFKITFKWHTVDSNEFVHSLHNLILNYTVELTLFHSFAVISTIALESPSRICCCGNVSYCKGSCFFQKLAQQLLFIHDFSIKYRMLPHITFQMGYMYQHSLWINKLRKHITQSPLAHRSVSMGGAGCTREDAGKMQTSRMVKEVLGKARGDANGGKEHFYDRWHRLGSALG